MPIIGSIGGGSAGGYGQRKGGIPPFVADFLVVAGGGSGGQSAGPGGGAGGYRTSFPGGTGVEIKGGNNTIVVGAGAAPNSYNQSPGFGTKGSNSEIQGVTTLTSAGGGGGGAPSPGPGDGGSGGGTTDGTIGQGNVPPTSPPQGNPGGPGAGTNGGGGGGGAGNAGGPGLPINNRTGGIGGNGTASNITGSSVTYAGGGGGATYDNPGNPTPTPGPGGSGGGGPGGNAFSRDGTPGTAGLGGGGGASGWNQSGSYERPPSGGGGSGRIIVRFPSTAVLEVSPGTNTITDHPGGDKLCTFNVTGVLNYDGGAE